MARRHVTLIFPYYENPVMMGRQLAHLAALPPDVKSALHLIVGDDGSSKAPLGPFTRSCMGALGLVSARLFRIKVDVRWNWIAVRNRAVDMADQDWVLMTDIDHLVPEATWRRIQERKLDARRAHKFNRVDAPALTPYKPHPNTWLMTRDLFHQVGGYDERFSGFYGSDGEFRDRLKALAGDPVILDEVVIRHPRDEYPDASTTRYDRKTQADRVGVTNARKRIAQDPTPHRLTFPWEEIL